MRLKILIVADHESKYIWDHFDRRAFEGVDLVISCGDLKSDYLSFLVTMIPVPLLYVRGNHDGGYKSRPPEGCVDLEEHMVKLGGIRFVGFGGCKSAGKGDNLYTDKTMRRRVMRMMPEIYANGGFDVLVTHSAALGVGDGADSFHQGFEVFNELLDQFKPAYHLHGHQHMNYTHDAKRVLQYGETTIINGYEYHIAELEFPDELMRIGGARARWHNMLLRSFGREK